MRIRYDEHNIVKLSSLIIVRTDEEANVVKFGPPRRILGFLFYDLLVTRLFELLN